MLRNTRLQNSFELETPYKQIMKSVIFALTFFALIACKNDDNSDDDSNSFANITTDIVKDTWKITRYLDNDIDETSDFASYTFTFKEDGTIDASNDLLTESGTWSYEDSSNDSTDDDGIENDEEFIITFLNSNNLDDISEEWHITSATSTQIVLYNISDDGTTDILTFTKQ